MFMLFLVDNAKIVISTFIILFNVVGQFGNISLVIAVFKQKKLQSRNGILMAILSFEHSACLFGQLLNVYYNYSEFPKYRSTCLQIEALLIFSASCQTAMFLIMSVDILLDILCPIFVRKLNKSIYITFICLLPCIFPSLILYEAFSTVDSATIFLCNPPLSLPLHVRRLWTASLMAYNFPTLISYILLLLIIYRRDRKRTMNRQHGVSPEKKVMHSLSILITVFILLWFIYGLIVHLVPYFNIGLETSSVIQSYASILASICFSQNFYVCFLRSDLYRDAFLDQLSVILPCLNHKFKRSIRKRGLTTITTVRL